jgi:hypothetical protein
MDCGGIDHCELAVLGSICLDVEKSFWWDLVEWKAWYYGMTGGGVLEMGIHGNADVGMTCDEYIKTELPQISMRLTT